MNTQQLRRLGVLPYDDGERPVRNNVWTTQVDWRGAVDRLMEGLTDEQIQSFIEGDWI